MHQRILYVRLPCNPIFPIGVVYLGDRVHQLVLEVEQRILPKNISPMPLNCYKRMKLMRLLGKPLPVIESWKTFLEKIE